MWLPAEDLWYTFFLFLKHCHNRKAIDVNIGHSKFLYQSGISTIMELSSTLAHRQLDQYIGLFLYWGGIQYKIQKEANVLVYQATSHHGVS